MTSQTPTPPTLKAVSHKGGQSVAVRGLEKTYGVRKVLQHLDLSITAGEFVAIVGRSGCGKSTLLRILSGLESPTAGSVSLNDDKANAHGDVRFMFQEPRLLPWKSVIANVALGLDRHARPQAEEALRHVGLGERAGDWPSSLSGGQKQRVALARALVHEPSLLLLDEPLGALDALTRIEMQRLIESLWQRQRFTAVLVTHDVAEAVALADRVILLEDGRVALDERIDLPRPRHRGDPAFAAQEERILERVLGSDSPTQDAASGQADAAEPPKRHLSRVA